MVVRFLLNSTPLDASRRAKTNPTLSKGLDMKNTAKKTLLTIALVTFAGTSIADDTATEYKAKVTDDGKFCAKVKVRDYTGNRTAMKCRTLAQWKAKGYSIKLPEASKPTDASEQTNQQDA